MGAHRPILQRGKATINMLANVFLYLSGITSESF